MKIAPPDFNVAWLEFVLRKSWSLHPNVLEYLPLGFGDHHWRASSADSTYFVTLTDLRLSANSVAQLEHTLQAVRALVSGRAQRVRVCTRCLKAGKVVKAA